MLTIDDLQALLNIIASNRLTILGNEAIALAKLQQKLALMIDAARNPQPEKDDGSNSPGLTK